MSGIKKLLQYDCRARRADQNLFLGPYLLEAKTHQNRPFMSFSAQNTEGGGDFLKSTFFEIFFDRSIGNALTQVTDKVKTLGKSPESYRKNGLVFQRGL